MQLEIDRLCSKVKRRERDRRSLSSPPSDGSRGSRDRSFRRRSRTPSSESYSASTHKDRWQESDNSLGKRPSYPGMGNDAMSKAL